MYITNQYNGSGTEPSENVLFSVFFYLNGAFDLEKYLE